MARFAIVSPTGEGHLGVSLAAGLRACGHAAQIIDDEGLSGGTRELVAARAAGREPVAQLDVLVDRTCLGLRGTGVDAVLVMRGRFVSAAGVARLRAAAGGAPVVNVQTDNLLYPPLREAALLASIPAYDLVTIFDAGLAAQLDARGARRTAVLAFAYDPELYAPAPEPAPPPTFDAVFVGSWSPERQVALEELVGLRLAVAGGGWEAATSGRPLAASVLGGARWGRGAAALYRDARVGLNVLHPSSLPAHNMRTFELPATGVATVATRTPAHERIYGTGGAVLVQDGEPGGWRAAVEALLADPVRRAAVARAGREAVAAGTYEARGRELAGLVADLPG